MIEAKLVVVGGDTKTKEVDLHLPTVIGRGREVNLTLPHALVSRRHCEIYEKEGRLVVKDLGSLNGTFIDNTRIEGEQILGPSQLLTLGTVTFRAVYEIGSSLERCEESTGGITEKLMETVGNPSLTNSVTSDLEPVFVETALEEPNSSVAGANPVEKSPADKETVYDQSKKDSDTDQDLEKAIIGRGDKVDAGDVDAVPINSKVMPNPSVPVTFNSVDDRPQAAATASVVEEIETNDDREPGSFLRKLPR